MAISGLDQISSLDIWYKFDQGSYHDDAGTTLCTNGQTIHYEKDFSGNGRHSLQPTDGVAMKYSSSGINSKGTTIEDLATNRAFNTLTYACPATITLATVFKINHFYAGGNFYTLASFSGGNNLQLLANGQNPGGSVYPPGIYDAVNTFTNVSTPVFETDDHLTSGADLPHLVMWEIGRTSKVRKMWYDNVKVIDTTVASTITAGTVVAFGSESMFGNFFFGAIGEIGLWGKALSSLERAQVVEYLIQSSRWNLSGITIVPSRNRLVGMVG